MEMKSKPLKEIRHMIQVLALLEKKVHQYRIEVRNIYIKEVKAKSEYRPFFGKNKATRDAFLESEGIE